MFVTLAGIVTLVKPLQPENAKFPIFITLFGILTPVKSLHPSNAEGPMDVTGHPSKDDGITTEPVGFGEMDPISASPSTMRYVHV